MLPGIPETKEDGPSPDVTLADCDVIFRRRSEILNHTRRPWQEKYIILLSYIFAITYGKPWECNYMCWDDFISGPFRTSVRRFWISSEMKSSHIKKTRKTGIIHQNDPGVSWYRKVRRIFGFEGNYNILFVGRAIENMNMKKVHTVPEDLISGWFRTSVRRFWINSEIKDSRTI
mgnify:CR=1 FL=1